MTGTLSQDEIIQMAREKYPTGICYEGCLTQNELCEMRKECDVRCNASGIIGSNTYYIMFKGKSAKRKMRCDTLTTRSQYLKSLREFEQFCHMQKQTPKKCAKCKYHILGIDCRDVWMVDLLEA